MKYCIYLLTLISLISFIYSEYSSDKINIGDKDNEKSVPVITGCEGYNEESTELSSICDTCENTKALSTDK